jgi:hypothetical protein
VIAHLEAGADEDAVDAAGFDLNAVGSRTIVDGNLGKELVGQLVGRGAGDAFGLDLDLAAVGAFDLDPAVDVADADLAVLAERVRLAPGVPGLGVIGPVDATRREHGDRNRHNRRRQRRERSIHYTPPAYITRAADLSSTGPK